MLESNRDCPTGSSADPYAFLDRFPSKYAYVDFRKLGGDAPTAGETSVYAFSGLNGPKVLEAMKRGLRHSMR